MSKLIVKCFQNGAEILSSSIDDGKMLFLEFDTEYSGQICLAGITKGVNSKICPINTEDLPDGIYTPYLVVEGKSIPLPQIQKIRGVIIPKEYSISSIRRLSIENKIQGDQIAELEKRLKTLENKVFGRGILG